MPRKCAICSIELSHHAAKRCKSCAREYQLKYQREYRENNKEACYQRSLASYYKKEQYYKDQRRVNYRKKRGIPIDDPFRKRKDGEGSIDSSGYKTITVHGHPNQMDDRGRIREHVYIMSQHLGRPLTKNENVHHKNGIRTDNRVENLELWHKGQPPGQRVEDKVKWCLDFLSEYGYKLVLP